MAYEFLNVKNEPDFEPDRAMHFYVFMLAFWPVAITLALIDFYMVHDYDLRIPSLLVGLGAGWIAMAIYQRKELERFEAVEVEDEGRVHNRHQGSQGI